MEPFRRKPYVEKFIKDLKPIDFRVALSGIIVNKAEASFLLDDGTAQIRVNSDTIPSHGYLRVFGTLSNTQEGLELQSEIIQDLSKIDKKLHKKVKTLYTHEQ